MIFYREKKTEILLLSYEKKNYYRNEIVSSKKSKRPTNCDPIKENNDVWKQKTRR